jgi:hypothetical protein
MATLLEVAGKLGSLISKNAPVKTGKLKRALKTQNTGRNILSGRNSAQAEKDIMSALKSGTFSFEFNIDVSPPGAEYGQWWNDPTVSRTVKNGKTSNVPSGINFAQKAYDSPEFQAELNRYIDTLADKIAESVAKNVDKELNI